MSGRFFLVTLGALTIMSCIGRRTATSVAASTQDIITTDNLPAFNADSAMSYLAAQTAFGPRVPNTQAHKDCAAWLQNKFESLGVKTSVQRFKTTTFDNTELDCFNIIGSINPDCTTRIIVCSHWDSRPWADADPDPANHKTPVDAANDGASGVAVCLELARLAQMTPPAIGVDFIFFDAEDWGPGDDFEGRHLEEYWGLGTQYWASNPHVNGYKARYAILLDMVGGKGAQFPKEQYSTHYAKGTVDKVWNIARSLGFGSLFPETDGGVITDDHVFINRIAKIPAIDIVPCVKDGNGYSFGPTWHTVSDNLDHIDPKVIDAVGRVLTSVMYNEKK